MGNFFGSLAAAAAAAAVVVVTEQNTAPTLGSLLQLRGTPASLFKPGSLTLSSMTTGTEI